MYVWLLSFSLFIGHEDRYSFLFIDNMEIEPARETSRQRL